MKKLFIFLYIFFFINNQTFAYSDIIEKNFKQCLKNSNGYLDMIACTEEASNKTEVEISKLLNYPNLDESIKTNQELWKEYEKSVKSAVNEPLLNALGWMYYLFASENIYQINKDRLHVLEHLLKNSEYPISPKLSKINIAEYLDILKETMEQDKYITLIKNQKDWKKYKTSLEELLIDSKYKANIIQDLNGERNSQLWCLYHLFTGEMDIKN